MEEDAGTGLFYADNEGNLDLYSARGCGQYPSDHEYCKDKLMINDGLGNYIDYSTAIPDENSNFSSEKPADFSVLIIFFAPNHLILAP